MSNISIITTDFDINGNLLNAIDMQNYFQCDMYVLLGLDNFVRRYIDIRKVCNRNFRVLPFKGNVKNEVIIVDYKTFLYILIHRLDVKCDKLIVMDCIELTLHQRHVVENRMFLIKGMSPPDVSLMSQMVFPDTEIQFLMPECNHRNFAHNFKCDVFHKKINFGIIEYPLSKNDGFIYRIDPNIKEKPLSNLFPDSIGLEVGDDILSHHNFIYHRRSHLSFIEQLGRIVFEMVYGERKVWVSENLLDFDDGLTEHLKLLGATINNNELVINGIEDMNMLNYDYMCKYL